MSCPCGIGKDYSSCCAPLHKGEQKAKTAEQLMRSRYCAFAKEEIDYVISTQDSASRGELNRQEIEIWSKESEWKNIDVLATEDGLESDEEGVVEFKATYEVGDKEVVHHERSTFKKEDGDWFFVEGDVIRDQVTRSGPKVGRNDPCPCGSGKKYKKCCL